jgi:ER-bound oxygenase mpaB/B'/Rubber oxygenase, catalytic domain
VRFSGRFTENRYQCISGLLFAIHRNAAPRVARLTRLQATGNTSGFAAVKGGPVGLDIAGVGLDTERAIDTEMVARICCLPDDLFRLRWVSYAYHNLDERLSVGLGDNASWPAFARWSAYTIGEALRLDEVNPRLEDVLRDHALPARITGPLVRMQRYVRTLDDGAMPRMLALGNRLVFHEVGWTVAHFLTWIDGQQARDTEAWDAYERAIEPFPPTDFFRPSYPEWLRGGMRAYYDAWWERDPDRKAQLVLLGNMLIGGYEQWRVDSFFEVALDFNPGTLIDRLRIANHDDLAIELNGIRRGEMRRSFRQQRGMLNWMSDAYAAFLTRCILTWDAPLESRSPTALRLGCDLPARRGALPVPPELEDLDDDVQRIFDSFDRSGGQLRGTGARNWRRFSDRMSFIVNLFRTQQQNPNLRVAPSFEDRRLLELQLTDQHLDGLRLVGDPLGDDIRQECIPHGEDPRTFARGFLARGEPYHLLRNAGVEIDYPAWVDEKQIARGQAFFRDHALEIGSALFCASLPMAYTAVRGSRVLLATSALVSDVNRRIAETGRLLLDVLMPNPNGLRPGSPGYTTALAVRGFHATVRAMLAGQEPWRSEWREMPINQEDLLGTLTTFTVVVMEALETMGVEFSREDCDAYVHTWLVVGHLLGIDYNQLRRRRFNQRQQPLTYFELQLLRDAIFRRHAGPSPSGQILTRALLNVQEQALPRVLRPMPAAAIRWFIGDDAADWLEVPPAGPYRVLLNSSGPLGSATEWVSRGRIMQPRLADMTTEMFRRWISEHEGTPRQWNLNGARGALGLRPDIADVAAVEQEEALNLWEANGEAAPPRAAEILRQDELPRRSRPRSGWRPG